MVIGVWSLEWLSHNSQRAYPFTMDSTRYDISRSFRIPDDFLVSMHLAVPWTLGLVPDRFFVSRILADSMGYQLSVSYLDRDDQPVTVATAVVPVNRFQANQVRTWVGVGEYSDITGHFIVGSLDNINNQPRGDFSFNLEDGRLEPDVIRPEIRGVTRLVVENGQDRSPPLVGRIRLLPGRNIRLTPIFEPGKDPVLRIDAISGEGLIEECICQDLVGPPIRTINGVRPVNGRIDLVGTHCAVVENKEHSIEIKDRCAEPCCGCEELESITRELESIGDRITTWENFLSQLSSRVTQLEMNVLASKFGDRSCVPETPCP